jgi:D-alanine-D-alanine ligase-like ATP-grasp enzyme
MTKIIRGVIFEILHYYYRICTKYRLSRPELGIVARNRSQYYGDMWRDAARHLGADIKCLGGEIYEIRKSDKVMKTWQAETSLDNQVDIILTGNKPLIAKLLSDLNVPTPRYLEFDKRSLSDAMAFLAEFGKPVVVKPPDGTGGGNSVVTNITTRSGILKAAANARVSGSRLLIEEQIEGENYRLFYLDGELIDCVLRKPPTLTGDGKSTLRQLVNRENRDRLAAGTDLAQVLLTIDMDMTNTLAAQGLKLSSIPAAGQRVVMKEVINQNGREDNQAATERLSESIAKMGSRIVKTIGSRIVGIDVITKDPSIPLEESGGVLLEVNSSPGLYYHNEKTGDGAYVIAVEILRRGLSIA